MQTSLAERENTIFALLSFEGPDPYSFAGGLGARVTSLSGALSRLGYDTHLFFVGDPKAKGEETINRGRLTLHRWSQWISSYYPEGVYQGEESKVNDFNTSIPPFILERILKPALLKDKLAVIMAEEWHTAEAVCRLSELLRAQGIRDRVVIFWNANNTFGFNRIDWPRLTRNATITTVSRYMKYIMRGIGINPLVIPNGIPEALLDEIDDRKSIELRERTKSDLLLTKVARYDSAKGWDEAVEATARLNGRGIKTVMLARGGIEPFGGEVLYKARQLGLKVAEVTDINGNFDNFLHSFGNEDMAEIVDIKSYCPPELLRILYKASDAVLANSRHEPFGLVGLETMAAGGVAFTGGTGEDYAIHMYNAIVLETSDPREIEDYIIYLRNHKGKERDIRREGHHTARRYVWERAVTSLVERANSQALIQGILPKTLSSPRSILREEGARGETPIIDEAILLK